MTGILRALVGILQRGTVLTFVLLIGLGSGSTAAAFQPLGVGCNIPGTPGTPTDEGASTSSSSVSWSWTAPAAAGSVTITDYQIDIGTSAGASDVASATSTSNSTSYTKTGLSDGTYYARVRAIGTNSACGGATVTGSYSGNSDGITVALADTTAPTLSSPSVGSITTSGATVTWTTNESATSQVQSGTSSGSLGSSTTATSSYVTSHSVSLSGLSAGTTYYVRGRSADQAGNTGNSSETSFTTTASTSTSTTTDPPADTTTATSPSSSSSSSSTSSGSSTSSSPSTTTSSESSTATTRTETAKPKTETTKPGTLNVYSTAYTGLPEDTITEVKSFATLPAAPTTVKLTFPKAVSKVSGTFQDQPVELTKVDDKTYTLALTAPDQVADLPVKLSVTYTDKASETIDVTVAIKARGVVSDEAGLPSTSATVTLQKKAEDGSFATWDAGTTGQANPATTNEKGEYGFVVEAGTYQVSVTTADGRTVTSDPIEIGPTSGPVAPSLTLIAAASQEPAPPSGLPWWIWLILLILVVSLIVWWRRRKSSDDVPTPNQF